MLEGVNGVTQQTPERIPLGAGTIHKGLKYTDGTGWNFDTSIVCATSGGNKLTIAPEIYYPEIDGVYTKLKETATLLGGTATMEINPIELTKDIVKSSVLGKEGTSADETLALIESKADIEEDDFWDNVAFVGKTIKGKKIIAILDNALCTSGLDLEGKSKEASVPKFTFECHGSVNDNDHRKLPWHIYWPED